MISRLSGILESIDEQQRALVVQSIGGGDDEIAREVLLPGYLAARLAGRFGQRVVLVTLEHLEAQGQGTSFIPRLLGFGSIQEREFFELMRSVKGLGNRKALRALAEEPSLIAQVIAEQDAKSLQKLPEIGKRMSETILVDLKDKMGPFLLAGMQVEMKGEGLRPTTSLTPAASDAVEGLVALGESRPEAERLVERVLSRAEQPAETTEQILAAALGARG